MDPQLLYEQDFFAWTQQQAKALGQRQIAHLDWQHLKEEIDALGRQEYRELVSRLCVLCGHLLQWHYQPDQRTRSWFLTIREQRRAVRRHLQQNPSLQSCLSDTMTDAYEAGVDLALRETNLPLCIFPQQPPFSFPEIMDDLFWCDTTGDWEP